MDAFRFSGESESVFREGYDPAAMDHGRCSLWMTWQSQLEGGLSGVWSIGPRDPGWVSISSLTCLDKGILP